MPECSALDDQLRKHTADMLYWHWKCVSRVQAVELSILVRRVRRSLSQGVTFAAFPGGTLTRVHCSGPALPRILYESNPQLLSRLQERFLISVSHVNSND